MAAPLPNENDIREAIRSKAYGVDPVILNALDRILSDYLVAMVLSIKNYIEEEKPMDVGHAEVLLAYSRSMNDVFKKVMHPFKIEPNDNELLQNIKNNQSQMHKEIRTWLTHHIGNDTQAINFIIGDFVDDKNPIPVKSLEESILTRIEAITEVLSVLLASLKEKR
ncbi:MAG: hypothetical protein KC713_09015 [Candidatus Omnitrophica bacterium]|nr:hypothetical protein [Candidatus Omnitrophota bacterium]